MAVQLYIIDCTNVKFVISRMASKNRIFRKWKISITRGLEPPIR